VALAYETQAVSGKLALICVLIRRWIMTCLPKLNLILVMHAKVPLV